MIDTLKRLNALDRPINVAIIGAGSAGKGLLYQCGVTPGIGCSGIADLDLKRAVEVATSFGLQHRIVEGPGSLEDALAASMLPICEDGELLARSESTDVLVDASTAIADGARFALAALESGKDLVMMNAEADLLFGPHLMRLAQERGLVYTSCDGDQPGCIRRLVSEIELWGIELVMAGNIKGFLDRRANPTSIIPEAEKRFLDPKMCAGYTDGTKLSVEMALVANALDLRTMAPGMIGPRAERMTDVFDLFDFDAIHQTDTPVVDYVLGARPRGGVFVVGFCDSAYQQSMLGWFPSELGEGPYYVFERPYHLVHVEAMKCIVEAHLDREALLQPTWGLKTNVYAYAKRDLRRGDTLDGVGGYSSYGLIENCAENSGRPGVPICLAEGITVDRDIAADERIHIEDVLIDPNRSDFRLHSLAAAESW